MRIHKRQVGAFLLSVTQPSHDHSSCCCYGILLVRQITARLRVERKETMRNKTMPRSSMICSHNQQKGDVERTSSRWVKVGGFITDWPKQLTKYGDLFRTLQPLFQ
jgi:hypothetical protein